MCYMDVGMVCLGRHMGWLFRSMRYCIFAVAVVPDSFQDEVFCSGIEVRKGGRRVVIVSEEIKRKNID